MIKIPSIELVKDRFEGKVSLPIWKDLQSRQGKYGSLDSDKKSNGEFFISIGGDMVSENPAITNEHLNAYEFLITHSKDIYNAILARLFSEYHNLQSEYGYNKEDAKEIMPDIDNIEQFNDLIGLSQIHLLNVSKDNFAYVGYEFDCTWDGEHGLGFMTHKDRIIDFGGADMSFLTWVARQDLDIE
ncbi:MAG: hypothetical protein MUE85_05560 [Microscillaceae bacterium]|jgi:hypothetical protein|nr:hypothetical protein [Microscillaceae bacterium]